MNRSQHCRAWSRSARKSWPTPYHCPRHRHNDCAAGGGHQRDPGDAGGQKPSAWRPAGHTGPLHQRWSGGQCPGTGPAFAAAQLLFCAFGQDDCYKKPRSLKSDFTLLPDTLDAALRGVQLQPMLV